MIKYNEMHVYKTGYNLVVEILLLKNILTGSGIEM